MTYVVPAETFCLVSLLAIRIGSALRIVPFFGGSPMPLLPWASLSVVLALVVAPSAGLVSVVEFGGLVWLALAAKEVFIGVFLGIMTRIAFSVLELAGGFISISLAPIKDGSGEIGETQITSAYILLACAVFLVLDGHHALLSGLFRTVDCLPPGALIGLLDHSIASSKQAIGLFVSAMGTAVLVSIPVFAAGICADIIVGMISQIAPGGSFSWGSQVTRSIVVQLVALATLGVVISFAVDFLINAMNSLDVC